MSKKKKKRRKPVPTSKTQNKKAPRGSGLIVVFGSLAAVISSASASVEDMATKIAMLSVTAVFIVICLVIIYRQKQEEKEKAKEKETGK